MLKDRIGCFMAGQWNQQMILKFIFLGLCLSVLGSSWAADKIAIRVGVQALGTLEWELQVLQVDPLFNSSEIALQVIPLANAEAGKIALQSDSVDMIVSDWIWVSSIRASSGDLTFYPYSNTSGALLVPKNSPIYSIVDLKGKHLGIAGGELDKNWLLLQALAQKENVNLSESVDKVFGAPPLLNEQLKQDRLDAVLTYWHFAARLETQGYRQIVDGRQILQGLGIKLNVPSLGYVFKQAWGRAHKAELNNFFKALRQAKLKICTQDAVWQSIIPLTRVSDSQTLALLRQRYCQGDVDQWGIEEQRAAESIYQVLRGVSQNKLTGNAEHIQDGTFWTID